MASARLATPAAALSRVQAARRAFLSRATLLAAFTWLPTRLIAASPPRIVAVRAWPAEEYTRVTLEASAALEHEAFLLENPLRLVIDLKGVVVQTILRALAEHIAPDDPYIAAVRVGQFTPETTRIVFDLKQAVVPQIFLLDPIDPYQYRLVIDLYPEQPQDPVAQLLAELDKRQRTESDTPVLSETPPRRPAETQANRATNPRKPQPKPPEQDAPYVIVLDPGHGGEDPGAIGRHGTREKDVVLAVARRAKKRFDDDPKTRAVLTRSDDYFIALGERVNRARRAQADLFVSIHADAFVRPDVAGSSVYALSDRGASSTAAKWLAQKENQSDLIGGVQLAARSDHVAATLLDLSITATRTDSLRLAQAVLAELAHVSPPHRPEVETANFAVLRNPDVPSVLVELAFISNPTEERRLKSADYQEQLAEAIYRGVKRYLERHAPRPRALMLAAQSRDPAS
ncbi:N-acetylmuramoyl-L-alanine amidase [Hydrogenophilus thermoluteolus]|uniref:N-acetylmuramoyl-L-alanine amidase n=1 Tax=Hydrogenophilus thermoluteolus TaxID=297 RepID=UPI0024A21CAA|nr:N-acetylmuramoyl-L-alanine amidase [Hydrogenophilus thermoluteolus]GLW60628.1 N-acetylmuramoyl-L-alanine amidase [Hydrogenophilus thermoluteolus]